MRETVVLVPGLQSDHRSWMHQIAFLEGRYDVVVPGGYHGLGTVEDMAACVLEQVPERFHLVAWSMGGYVALEMLPSLRGRLASLSMICTSARPEDPGNTRRRLENLAVAEKEGLAVSHRKSMTFSCVDYAAIDGAVRTELLDAAVRLGLDAFRAQQQAIIERPDGRRNIKLVDCPTLVVVGEADRVTPPERAREIAEGIAGSELVVLEGCGHCPPLERPDQVNALLGGWFERNGARARTDTVVQA